MIPNVACPNRLGARNLSIAKVSSGSYFSFKLSTDLALQLCDHLLSGLGLWLCIDLSVKPGYSLAISIQVRSPLQECIIAIHLLFHRLLFCKLAATPLHGFGKQRTMCSDTRANCMHS